VVILMSDATTAGGAWDRRRWLILGVIALAAGGAAWLAQLGPHTGYATGVLGPIILAAVGLGLVIAPVINTGTFGVAPQDAGVASATVTKPRRTPLSRGDVAGADSRWPRTR
jgi:hypothetical protein